MKNLKIEDEKGKVRDYCLREYELYEENDKLNIKLITDEVEICYEIVTDEREKDIDSIKAFINKQLQEDDIIIAEYLVRMYIYWGTDRRQFTAWKK